MKAALAFALGLALALIAGRAPAQTLPPGELASWLAQPTATGDWGGWRSWLLERGIDFQASYIGEVARNTNGLHSVATDYVHAIAFGADVDLGKLGIAGAGAVDRSARARTAGTGAA